MSVAASQRESGERSVAQVVAEWRERSARGEPIDMQQMLAEIERAEQAAARTDSLLVNQFPTVNRSEATDLPQAPTVALAADSGLEAGRDVSAQNAATLFRSSVFQNASSKLKARLRADGGSGTKAGLDDYDVLREIAKGGMGVVYEARQRSLNRVVALKMIKAGQLANEEDVARFYAEAEAAANLRHPNIVAVYEMGRAGEDADQHYFTMDYVAGPSLLDVIRKQPLSAREAAAYVVKVARAIQFAHDRNVLHRDLKPSNILLGEDGEPRVTDFGLAKRIDQDTRLTVAGAVVGTPAYMPPEQARGDTNKVGKGADIYSLGAVLYECVTGRPPFISSSLTEMLHQVLLDDPLPPSRLLPSLPRDYETICLKCLEKEPERRYTSAGELADDLERFLRDEPIRARPVGWLERCYKFARRKPAWAALWSVTAIAAVVLAVVIAFSTSKLAKSNVNLTKSVAEEQRQKKLANDRYDALLSSTYSVKIQKSEDYWTDDPPNVVRCAELLDSLAPKPGQRDPRGFEWFFLRRISDTRANLVHAGNFQVDTLVVRSDGRMLVHSNRGRTVIEYGPAQSTPSRWTISDKDTFRPLIFSRGSDWCVVMRDDGTIERRSLRTLDKRGVVVGRVNADAFPRAAISDDGNLVAFANSNEPLYVWSAATKGRQVHDPAAIPDLKEVAISPDGRWALTRGSQKSCVVEVGTPNYADFVVTRKTMIAGAAFSPDSRRLAMAFQDGVVDVHDLETLEPDKNSDQRREIKPVSFNLLRFFIYPNALIFLPGGNRVAIGSTNSLVVVIDMEKKMPVVYRGHRSAVTRLGSSADGKTLYSGGNDGLVLKWDLSVEDQRAHLIRDMDASGWPLTYDCLAYSPDGKWLAAGGKFLATEDGQNNTGRLLLVDVATREIIHRIDSPQPITACSFSPDSRRLVYGEANFLEPAAYHLWDVAAGRPAGQIDTGRRAVHSAAFAHDGSLLLGAADGTIHRATAGSPATEVLAFSNTVHDGTTPQVERLAASTHLPLLISKSDGYVLRLWNLSEKREELRSVGHLGKSAMALAAHAPVAAWTTPSPRLVESSLRINLQSSPEVAIHDETEGHRALVFDLAKNEQRFLVSGHMGAIHALAFSDDGKRLASGDSVGTLKLWDAETGAELLSMEGHLNAIDGLAFHPSGRQLASIGSDGVVRMWWTE